MDAEKNTRELTAEEEQAQRERMKETLRAIEQARVKKAERFAQKYAERLRNIKINWTEDHEMRMDELSNVVAKKQRPFDENIYITPSFWSYDLNILFLGCLEVMECFSDEWPHILTDRGNQTSLFNDTGHALALTDEQWDVWSNYYVMDPEERQFYFLRAAECVLCLQKILENESAKKAQLENFSTCFPIYYPLPLNKPVNLTFTGAISEAPQLLRLEGSKSKKKITGIATLTLNKEHTSALDNLRGLDMYDKQVHNAIVALFEHQGEQSCVATPQMIYSAMLANKNARLLPQSSDYVRIVNSMKKLFGYILDFDTADKDKEGNPKYNSLIPRRYVGPLLMGEYLEAEKTKINGQEIVGVFKIYRRPILDVLACETKQRTVIPATLLKLTDKSATENVIILKNEIAERIAWEKNADARKKKKRVSFIIKYKPLYSLVGITEEKTQVNMNRRQKVRDAIRKILDTHVKEKNINGYTEIKGHGRSIEGAEIQF